MSLKILEKCEKPFISQRGEIFACGQCPYCVRRRVMEWTIRANHELLTTPGHKAILLTLSYDRQHLVVRAKKKECPEDRRGVIVPEHMTLFMKRFRKFLDKNFNGKKIRYIYSQEYGDEFWRPHAHAVIYGLDWEELHQWCKKNKKWIEERNIKISQKHKEKSIEEAVLRTIWKQGRVHIDERAMHENGLQYVVGYVQKKIGNLYGGEKHYEDNNRPRPYMRTSRGIGKEWSEKNIDNWINTLKIGWNGKQVSIPRYYLKNVYKKEGETVSFTIKNVENEETKTYYYVLKNPEGEYTKKIIEKKLEIRLKERKKELEENKEIKDQLQKQFVREDKIQNEYVVNDFVRFENYKENGILLTNALKKQTQERIIEREKRKKMNKDQATISNEKIMTFFGLRNWYKEAREKAEFQNKKLRIIDRQGKYGKRNKYELSALLEDENFNNEESQRIDAYMQPEESKINWNKIFGKIKVKKEKNEEKENLFS